MQVDINKFKDIDLRVGVIKSVEKVENTDKLLHLKIDIGEDTPRDIISGVAEYFNTEDLVNQKCVVVTNLEKKLLKGIESNGMLLGSLDHGVFYLLKSDAEVGSKIS